MSEINGFLDRDVVLEGELRFADTMRLEGTILGRVRSERVLIVGDSGAVDGDVEVGELLVFGTVCGNICADRVEIHRGGVVIGDVVARTLRLDDGARLEGTARVVPALAAEVQRGQAEAPSPRDGLRWKASGEA